jgi:hypothetical protein
MHLEISQGPSFGMPAQSSRYIRNSRLWAQIEKESCQEKYRYPIQNGNRIRTHAGFTCLSMPIWEASSNGRTHATESFRLSKECKAVQSVPNTGKVLSLGCCVPGHFQAYFETGLAL